MNSKIYFVIIIFKILSILSMNEQSVELDIDKEIKVIMNSDTTYIVSKNTISGVYNYDIETPILLELTYANSDSKMNIPPPNEFKGHNETIKTKDGYIVSIDVSVSNDDKFTFIKLYNKEYKEDILIRAKLTCEYSWKISVILISIFGIGLIIIFLICIFGKNFLMKCCNYQWV